MCTLYTCATRIYSLILSAEKTQALDTPVVVSAPSAQALVFSITQPRGARTPQRNSRFRGGGRGATDKSGTLLCQKVGKCFQMLGAPPENTRPDRRGSYLAKSGMISAPRYLSTGVTSKPLNNIEIPCVHANNKEINKAGGEGNITSVMEK